MNTSRPLRCICMFLMFSTLSCTCFCGSGLPTPGHVEGWGDNTSGKATPPTGLDGVIAIAAGAQHSLALRTNGIIVGWGDNSSGQIEIPLNLDNVVGIAAGLHSAALKSDGTVVVWGSNDPA